MSQGIKETKELLVAVNELAIKIAGLAKDGVQVADAIALVALVSADSELQAKLLAAFQGAAAIKDEVKDLDVAEGVDLVVTQAQFVPKIIEALKK
jgi:hypothetical protein